MRFDSYFRTASFLLVLSALLSLVLTGELELPYTIIIVLGFTAGLLQERFNLLALSRAVLIFSIPFLAVDFFFISTDILMAFSHLLILVTCSRLCSLKSNSDYNQLYLLTFFDLLASSAMTINLSFAFTFTMYLISATWVMLLFHIKKEVEGREGGISRGLLDNAVTPGFFFGIAGVAVLSLIVTLAIFIVLPRVGIGLFSKQPGKTLKTTGFGDKVDFGQIGPVSLDETLVMRVELPELEKGLGTVYLRGTVLDYFNGVTWERKQGRLASLMRQENDFIVSKKDGTLVRQEIILDPIDSRVIFGMQRLVKLSGRFQMLFKDGYDTVYLPVNPFSRFNYTAYSDISRPAAAELAADRGPYSQDIIDIYTKTPPISEGVKSLVVSLTGKSTGPYQKAVAIESYLKNNYSYTLNPGRDESLSPLEDFLFKNREGYCDHFSTAMALMLRIAGVPSRLVTGYVTSEWNDLGRFYTVRQSNSHSWVEVYFPANGWVKFDPTPGASGREENLLAARIGLYIGYIRLKWDRYVINFTLQDQVNAAKEARRRTELSRDAILNLLKPLKFNMKRLFAPVAIVATALILIYLLIRKWSPARRMTLSTNTKTVPFYEEMLKILDGKGIARLPSLTPREFASKVTSEKGEDFKPVLEITLAFEKVRYGGIDLQTIDKKNIKKELDILRLVD